MNRSAEPSLVVIADSQPLCDVLLRVAQQFVPYNRVIGTTYSQCTIHLPRLIAENDTFILELLRKYPGGLRAEGAILGKSLYQRGKAVLLVSALSLSPAIDSTLYWDVGDDVTLRGKLAKLVSGEASASRTEWNRMERVLQAMLAIPPQHRE